MNINIAICDDDKNFGKLFLKQVLNMNWKQNKVLINIFNSGKKLIEKIKSGTKYDVVFMDIEFNDNYLGMDTAMVIKMIIPSSLIIYVSSYDSYFGDMVRAEPFYFLKKPVINDELQKSIDLVLNRLHYIYESYLYTYRFNGIINVINLNDVKYFESAHRIVIIHLNNDSVLQFYKKLDEVEQEISKISPYFLRANKSFLVNRKYIDTLSSNKVTITNDNIEIHITDKYLENFKIRYMKFVQDFR